MGLFDKKYCDVCGEQIKLLGNRKLEDGNLCKNCAAKLSPFFSERRHSTVSEIKEQLAYRENNKEKVAAFQVTKTLGGASNTKILLDEPGGKMIVTSARSWREANPDVIDLAAVTGCDYEVKESKTELKKDGPDGKKISYNPPRYDYDFNFYVTIHVNNPWFDEISFRLNSSTIDRYGSAEYNKTDKDAQDIKRALTQAGGAAVELAKPKPAVVCPHCGASTIPDQNNCCEYCGGALAGS